MSAPPPLAAIVVVTFNSRPFFARLRAALEAQTEQRFHLIVWDNASRDAQRPHPADFPGATIEQSERNLGFAAGNNHAADEVTAPYLFLLNPDAFPEPDWLERLLEAAEAHPEAGAIGATQISAEDPALYDGLGDCLSISGAPWRGGYGWRRDRIEARDGETFSVCGASALYRLAAWRAAGGFDESFFCYGEDVDLGFRLRLMGWTCRQAAAARVHHVGGASSGKRSAFAVYHGTRNRLWTFVKCMPAPLIWLFLPLHLAMSAAFLLVSPFRGTGPATWRGIGDGLKGLKVVWEARKAVQSQRRASIGSIAAALSWSPWAMIRRAPVLRLARGANPHGRRPSTPL